MSTDPDDPEMELHRRKLAGESIAPDLLGPLFQPEAVKEVTAIELVRAMSAFADGEERLLLTALQQVSPAGMTAFELDAALSFPPGRANAMLHGMLRRPVGLVRRTFICRKDARGTTFFTYAITPEGLETLGP